MNAPIIKTNNDVKWVPLAPGIEMQIFHADPKTGIWTVKIFMHGGSTLPPHRHVGASEFFILKGEGVHKEAGSFEVGTYAFEPEGAVHSPVHAEDDIILYMTSYGSGVFFKASGQELYTGDAAYFEKQMNIGKIARKIKHFFFISVWSVFYGKKVKKNN